MATNANDKALYVPTDNEGRWWLTLAELVAEDADKRCAILNTQHSAHAPFTVTTLVRQESPNA